MRPSSRPEPDPAAPGQESVWSYPRPPRLEATSARLRVVLGGEVIADTTEGLRVLETSHPPNYYFPPDDVSAGVLERGDRRSWCEFKGGAHYYDVRGGGLLASDAAWGYDDPERDYRALTGFVAFYPSRMDRCLVDDEVVLAQPGGFYGGWITAAVRGPFKGATGTQGW
jgi:uncharacterized protein (DUF427 family)